MELLGLWHYWVVIVLMMIGLYIVIARDNLVKKIMGLNIFQVSVIMFYVALGKVKGGTAPIITGTFDDHHGDAGHGDAAHGAADAGHGAADAGHGAVDTVCWDMVCPDGLYGMWSATEQACACGAYSNPLPHVLMLTAIVVGVATTALGLALVVRIQEAYGTVEEDDIARIDQEGA
jgi:multicomponent Na+:H+ antiporter subunit C